MISSRRQTGPDVPEAMGDKTVTLSIGLTVAFLSAGYALGGRPIWVLPLLALAAVWLAGWYRGWRWVDAAGLVGSSAAAAAGMGVGLGAGWMLAGEVAALSAWDLAAFVRWLPAVQSKAGVRDLVRRHLGRLLLADAIGLLLAALALQVRARLSLGVMVLLGLLAVLGLNRAMASLQRRE